MLSLIKKMYIFKPTELHHKKIKKYDSALEGVTETGQY